MTEEIKTDIDYDTCIGVRNEEAEPNTLADMFGLDPNDTPQTEQEARIELWKGLPKYTTIQKAEYSLMVQFSSKENYDKFIELIGFKTITPKTKSIWFPEIPKADNFLARFVDDDEV